MCPAALLLSISFSTLPVLMAQGRAVPTLTAARAAEGKQPVIDGRVDDDVWASAEPFNTFIQQDPSEGAPATERTEIRFLLDDRNRKLLAALMKNPRAPIATLARRVGLSAPAVRERLLRLEEGGVIKGWRVELDPKALGYPIAILVRVRPMPGQLPKIAKLAQSMPQVTECHRITGEDCFLMRLYLRSLDELDGLLDRFLAYGQTTTSIVQSAPVPPRALPLP